VPGTRREQDDVTFKVESGKSAFGCHRRETFAAKIMRSERRIPGGAPAGHRKSTFPDAPKSAAKRASRGSAGAADIGFADPKMTHARAFAKEGRPTGPESFFNPASSFE
jgi:hypothetical protein